MRRPMLQLAVALTLSILMQTTSARSVAAQTSLLEETVSFSGQVLFLETGVPGLVIGAVRDGDTLMRVGSITKVFTGAVLDVLSVSSSSGTLTEGTDYVWISGDRGGSFTHRQKSLLVFNPDLHEEGSAYTVYALVADSWDSVNELFSSLTGELVGLDVLLKPFNPVTTVVTLTVKGETSLG